MAERRSGHRTQWAAQFAVASELCKRNCEVALTLGNHPKLDLMVVSPKGVAFAVDVKGQYKPGFWIVRRKELRKNLFYVFAYVPDGKPNRFFVLTQAAINKEIPVHIARVRQFQIEKGRAGDKADRVQGVLWQFAEKFENRWDLLPG